MWFAHWFGRRTDRTNEEEPSATPPPPAVKTPLAPAKRTLALQPSQTEAKRKGFDPYNSGSFARHNAWERTGRR